MQQLAVQIADQKQNFTALQGRFYSNGQHHQLTLTSAQTPWGRGSASVALAGRAPFALQGKLSLQPNSEVFLPAIDLTLHKNLMEVEADFHAHAPWLTLQGRVELLPFEMRVLKNLALNLKHLDLHGIHVDAPPTQFSGTLQAAATTAEYLSGSFSLTNALAGPMSEGHLPVRSAHAKFSSDLSQLNLRNLDLKFLRGSGLSGSASLSAAGLSAQLNTRGLDLQAWHTKLQATKLVGSLQLQANSNSQQAQIMLTDRRQRYQAQLRRVGTQVQLHHVQLTSGASQIAANGEINLGPTQSFQAALQLRTVNPADFGNFPVAHLNGNAIVSGRLQPSWQCQLKLALANSRWRDQPLSGQVDATLNARRVWNSQGKLTLGHNQLNFQGALGDRDDQVAIDFKLQQLAHLSASWRGELRGQAHLNGTWQAPALNLTAEGAEIKGPNQLELKHLQLQIAFAPDLDAALHLQAHLTGARFGAISSEKIMLEVNGSGRTHQAQLTTQGGNLALQARLSGSLKDRRHWSGRLETFQATQPFAVRLGAPTALSVSNTGLSLGALQLTSEGAYFDVEEFVLAPGILRTRGKFSGFPLARLSRSNQDKLFKTSLQLAGDWDVNATQKLNGSVHLWRESGGFRINDANASEIKLQAAQLALTAQDNQLKGEASIRAERDMQAHLTFATQVSRDTAGWVIPASAPVTLNADANLPYLDWLGPLLHPGLVLQGQLQASMRAHGTYGRPALSGQISGSNLSVTEPNHGIRLTQGTLQAQFSEDLLILQAFRIYGKEGSLSASGQAHLGNEKKLNLHFQAHQLELLDRPNWNLNTNIEGTLQADAERAELTSRIHINHAKIALPERGAPSLAEDVVIKGRGRAQTEKPRTRLALDISIDFGNDCRLWTVESPRILNQDLPFYQNKLDARLDGQLRIQNLTAHQQGTAGVPNASGTLRVREGAYTFYGKRLDIKRGSLLFDGALNNPALDILAMNEQYQVKVGAAITGFALNPRVQLVSDPNVPDREKLSWLLFGRGGQTTDGSLTNKSGSSASSAIGLAAFGLQVTDRLYVGYEQGAVGASNAMTIYSRLNERLSAEARSGDNSALRLFYTFELK